jgi:hypothetical protein
MKPKRKTKHRAGAPSSRRRINPDIPPETQRVAHDVAHEYEQRLRADLDARKRTAEKIIDRGQRSLRTAVNDRAWFAIHTQFQHERAALVARLQPPGGVGRDALHEYATLKRRMKTYIRDLGIAADKVRNVGQEVFAELKHSVWARPLVPQKNFGTAAPMSAFTDLLGGIAGSGVFAKPHEFITLRPPFDSARIGFFSSSASAGADHIGFSREVAVDQTAGLVGHTLTGTITGASEFDIARGIADTQIEFLFKPPVAGLVEVLIEAQNGLNQHFVEARDEFGISWYEIDQQNFLMMHVLHPNVTAPSLASTSGFPWDNDEDDLQTREHLIPGGDIFARLVSDGPVPAGQLVTIRAGTRSDDYMAANDITLTSRSTFHWFIKAVHVRIAP